MSNGAPIDGPTRAAGSLERLVYELSTSGALRGQDALRGSTRQQFCWLNTRLHPS